METVSPFKIQKTKHSRLINAETNFEFGKLISDHMFICNFQDGVWQRARIVPFQDLQLSPATLALHYGQSLFEGMKAFRMQDDTINIFRIDKHHLRLNRSLARMCMPLIPAQRLGSGSRRQQFVHTSICICE